MTDFVDALEAELRRAAQRKGQGHRTRWPRWRAPRLLPAAAVVAALGIGLALVLAVRPAGEERPGAVERPRPTATTPPATPIPADVSPGARHSKRFGFGRLVAVSEHVPVYADIDRWRYCPRDPIPLTKADLPAARRAILAIVGQLTALDTSGAHAGATVVTGTEYAVHQCGTAMRRHAADVAVLLPKVTFSASLASIDVEIARTLAGWIVFDRRH
jgi:hypothetical protein